MNQIEFVKKVEELFEGTVIEGNVNLQKIFEENKDMDLEKLYKGFLRTRKQLKPYDAKWEPGDVLVTKDGQDFMIIYCTGEVKAYKAVNLSTGRMIKSYHQTNLIKQDCNFSIYNLIGKFDPAVVKIKKYGGMDRGLDQNYF